MATVNIKGLNDYEKDVKKETLQYLADNLSMKEIQNLSKIAKSEKARVYLNSKFSTLKFFLKL
jgi:hypothetical protein